MNGRVKETRVLLNEQRERTRTDVYWGEEKDGRQLMLDEVVLV